MYDTSVQVEQVQSRGWLLTMVQEMLNEGYTSNRMKDTASMHNLTIVSIRGS